MAENILTDYDSFFFLGIGGVSMSALAKLLFKTGKRVAGYDRCEGEYTDELKSMGIEVTSDYGMDLSGSQVIVYTDALPESNAYIIQARRMRRVLISRGRLLVEVSRLFKSTVAVAGCHGKTTCTSMIAHILDHAQIPFASHIGGKDASLSNCCLKGYDVFVTEACEYKRNFLYLNPDVSVILNSDADHLDCYGTAENLRRAYVEFAAKSGKTIKLYGDLGEVDGITFGFDDRADYYAKNMRNVNGSYCFTAYERGKRLGGVSLSVCGKHNVLNALAAIAAMRVGGMPFGEIAEGLASFTGVERRFERIGKYNGATCIADYAHHPTEIRAALKTARLITDGELYVVFQPHTYSRTKSFFKQFVSALSPLRKLMVYKTFAAREYYDDAGSALTLAGGIKRACYGECETDIENFLRGAAAGDTVLFLGAGDIYDVAKDVINIVN